jgi:mannose-6-phosphate isomerase
MTIDLTALDSFVILIVTSGDGCLTDNEGNICALQAGNTLLVPASTNELKVEGTVKFLLTYA